MNKPLLVEIIAYAPTAFYHCLHCEVAWRGMGKSNRVQQEQLDSSLPADLAQDYHNISNWVREMFGIHCDRLVVKVIDAASVEGVIKSLRYKVRHYPALIIDRKTRLTGVHALTMATSEINRLLDMSNFSAHSA
jgi:hypothetical protein